MREPFRMQACANTRVRGESSGGGVGPTHLRAHNSCTIAQSIGVSRVCAACVARLHACMQAHIHDLPLHSSPCTCPMRMPCAHPHTAQEYVQARLRQFSRTFAQLLSPALPEAKVERSYTQALALLGANEGSEEQDAQLRFTHRCK